MAKQQAHYEVMEKLLKYFEKQDHLEDATGSNAVPNIPGLDFVSYVTFEGVPILPPVMCPLQREEMLLYRKQFIASETRMTAKTKTKLLQRVEDVLAEIEDQQKRLEGRQSRITQDLMHDQRPSEVKTRLEVDKNQVRNCDIATAVSGEKECEILTAVSSLKDKVLQGHGWEDTMEEMAKLGLNQQTEDEGDIRVYHLVSDIDNTENRSKSQTSMTGMKTNSQNGLALTATRSFKSPVPNLGSISRIQTSNTPTPPRLTPTWSAELPKSSPPQKERSSTFTLTQLAEVIHGTGKNLEEGSTGDDDNGDKDVELNKETTATQAAVDTDVNSDTEKVNEEKDSSDIRNDQTSGDSNSDQRDDTRSSRTRDDSEPEILVDQSQSEESEFPTEMTMGLQLLRQKLQQQQQGQSGSLSDQALPSCDYKGTTTTTTVTLSHLATATTHDQLLSSMGVYASQDSIASSRKQSTALRIQQSLFRAPQVGGGGMESVGSSVMSGAGGTLSGGEDLMNTVVVRGKEEVENDSEVPLDQAVNHVVYNEESGPLAAEYDLKHDKTPNTAYYDMTQAAVSHGNQVTGPLSGERHDSDKENERPDHPLLSRAAQAFEGTPNVSPDKQIKGDVNEQQPELPTTDDLSGLSIGGDQIQAGEDAAIITTGDVHDISNKGHVTSLGPTKTPNLSNISYVDSEEGETSNGQEMSGHYLHSVTTDELYTKSTELGKYMHTSADTMQDSLCTLPHLQVGCITTTTTTEEVGEDLFNIEELTPRPDDALPSYSETFPIEIETTPIKTSFILQPVKSADNSESTQELVPGTKKNESEVLDSGRDDEEAGLVLAAGLGSSNIHEGAVLKSSRSAGSGPSSQERVRRNSYTLDHPSPALVATHTEDMTASCRKSDFTGSMEDLRIKPVHRQLDLDNNNHNYQGDKIRGTVDAGGGNAGVHREVEQIGGERMECGESDTAGVVVLPVDDEEAERSGKQEHLQRYLQALHTAPVVPDTSEDDDSTMGFLTRPSIDKSRTNTAGVLPQITPGMSDHQGSSDTVGLQHQMAYFEQLQQQMMQQQQDQLQQLLAEQDKQQRLFKQELLKQSTQLNEKKRSSVGVPPQPSGQAHSLDQQQLQAWLKQLQGFPQLTHSLPLHSPHTGLEEPPPLRSGQKSLPLDALATQLRGAFGLQGNEENYKYSAPMVQNYMSSQSHGHPGELQKKLSTVSTGSHGDTEFAAQTYMDTRPDSGLSNASTLTPADRNSATAMTLNQSTVQSGQFYNYDDPSRPLSELSYISELLRPQSAPTPRMGNNGAGNVAVGGLQDSAQELGSPAGPSGVYYNPAVPTMNPEPNANNSYHHHSPAAVLRNQNKVSPLPQPLQSVFNTSEVILGTDGNHADVTLSSEKSVHFADPVHRTQLIERSAMTGVNGVLMGSGGVLHRARNRPDLDLNRCFARVTAAVRGYLTRRLLHTGKVQQLIKTIRDTAEFAIHFQQESAIKRGVYSDQDKRLQERVINQLTAAMYEIHDIFFETTVADRMMYIQQDRLLERERLFKEQDIPEKKHKVSAATLKARERKKKLQAAEEILFGQVRPKSAPPSSRSPRKQRSTDLRALKPSQSNVSPRKPTARETRPGSAVKDTKTGVVKGPAPRKIHPQVKPQVTKPRTKPTVTSTVAKKIPQSAKLPVRKIARHATTLGSQQQPPSTTAHLTSTTPGVAMPTTSTGAGSSRSSNPTRNFVNAKPIHSTSTPVTTSYRNAGVSLAKTAAH